MSTRAMYTFSDTTDTFHVYKHHDGYPTGAAIAIENARPHAWQQGRFEADEFGAAFVAGNKSHYVREELELLRQIEVLGEAIATEESGREIIKLRDRLKRVRDYARNAGGGGVRLMPSGSVYAVAPADIEWRYVITSQKGQLHVEAYATHFWETRTKADEQLHFEGTLEAFKAWAFKGEGK